MTLSICSGRLGRLPCVSGGSFNSLNDTIFPVFLEHFILFCNYCCTTITRNAWMEILAHIQGIQAKDFFVSLTVDRSV